MRLRSPLPLAALALVVHIPNVPFASATTWTAARKLEMRFVGLNPHENGFFNMRMYREATRRLWYHGYNAYMDYGVESKPGEQDTRTESAVQRFLWTSYDLCHVQEVAQTGTIRSSWC